MFVCVRLLIIASIHRVSALKCCWCVFYLHDTRNYDSRGARYVGELLDVSAHQVAPCVFPCDWSVPPCFQSDSVIGKNTHLVFRQCGVEPDSQQRHTCATEREKRTVEKGKLEINWTIQYRLEFWYAEDLICSCECESSCVLYQAREWQPSERACMSMITVCSTTTKNRIDLIEAAGLIEIGWSLEW